MALPNSITIKRTQLNRTDGKVIQLDPPGGTCTGRHVSAISMLSIASPNLTTTLTQPPIARNPPTNISLRELIPPLLSPSLSPPITIIVTFPLAPRPTEGLH